MSFSGKIKEELSKEVRGARHCMIAEFAAINSFVGSIAASKAGVALKMTTENKYVSRKYFTLLKKAFNIETDVSKKTSEKNHETGVNTVIVDSKEDVLKILSAIKIIKDDGSLDDMTTVNEMLFMNTCCKRAFLRGAFLAAGSVGDPNKSYHLEIVCPTMERAKQIQGLIWDFEIDAKIVARKKAYVVYIKEGAGIVDFLNVIEAHVALMDLENVRILKEMRNAVNRQVNCETANINKTITASMKQIEDIEYIRDSVGLETLSDNLKEMAYLRIEHPEANLNDLGRLLSPPIGKSGVNHRLRKISEIADNLRES
ncbi:MAG: DNA-binding protein WhiA [Parasporobacterium sp.]|nr:DNA-binding protein WhiA [Parasporobacterium sp.]